VFTARYGLSLYIKKFHFARAFKWSSCFHLRQPVHLSPRFPPLRLQPFPFLPAISLSLPPPSSFRPSVVLSSILVTRSRRLSGAATTMRRMLVPGKCRMSSTSARRSQRLVGASLFTDGTRHDRINTTQLSSSNQRYLFTNSVDLIVHFHRCLHSSHHKT